MISAVPLPGDVCAFVGVEGAVDPFAVGLSSVWTLAPKSLGRFLNTRLSLSLSELGGKGDDFPNIILAGRVTDAEEAEVKVDVELPAVDGDAEAEADSDGDDAVVLVPGLKRVVPGLDLVLISPAELDLLGPIPIANPDPPPPPAPPRSSSMSELNPPPLEAPNAPGLGGNGNPPTSTPMRFRISLSSVSHSIWLICSRVRMGIATVFKFVFVLALDG